MSKEDAKSLKGLVDMLDKAEVAETTFMMWKPKDGGTIVMEVPHSLVREMFLNIADKDKLRAAITTLEFLDYTYEGGNVWKPPISGL